MTLEKLVRNWQDARRALLAALNDNDTWLKHAKKGGREVDPVAIDPLWQALATAEAALNAWQEASDGI